MPNQMTPDEAKASLGIATALQQKMMPKAQPQAPQTQEMGNMDGQMQQPQQTAPPEKQAPQMADFEAILTSKLEGMRKELKADSQKEIEEIKNDLKTALNEDDTEEKTSQTSD